MSVEQQNDGIFAVEKLLEHFVQPLRVSAECLSEGHGSDLVATADDDPLFLFALPSGAAACTVSSERFTMTVS
jgi:hypothetical protein